MIDTFNLPVAIDMMVAIEQARTAPVHEGDRHQQSDWGRLTIAPEALGDTDLVVDRAGNLVGVGTCGTARCAAGWVLSNARIPLMWDRLSTRSNGMVEYYASFTAAGEDVPLKASELLGIPWLEYDGEDGSEEVDWWDYAEGFPTLFNADNTVDDLYDIVADYAGVPEAEVRNLVAMRMPVGV